MKHDIAQVGTEVNRKHHQAVRDISRFTEPRLSEAHRYRNFAIQAIATVKLASSNRCASMPALESRPQDG